ncbi:hypothetical protein B0H13DRAFT_1931714 [Mycena leptocephala]|nr:hypothetical protein B0H13DRAFT_1931714 [Mycena leptocephala]
MSHGTLDYDIMTTQAEVHKLKSEYVAARSIHTRILEETSIQHPYIYGLALLNVAEIDVMIGAPKNAVQRNCDRAQKNVKHYLYLREGNSWQARLFLGIYKALRFLGEIFVSRRDEYTAISLFTVALEGFTEMDVHRSRADCMLQLGDISMAHGDLLKAVEFWERARPLFERSSQTKQVQHINERLAGISKDVLEQYRHNLARLAELNAPVGTIKELEDDLSDIEDLDKMDIGDEKELGLTVA